MFDAAKLEDFSSFSFHMWPGWCFKLFSPPASEASDPRFFLNLRSLHQVIRLETVLEKLLIVREMSIDQNLDYQEEIRKVFAGVKIVSKYN